MAHSRWTPAAFATLACMALGAAPAPAQSDSIEAAFDAWNLEHGGAWRLTRETGADVARCIWGGRAPATATPRSDAEFFARAREVLAQTHAIHGVELATLTDDAVHFLPLANAGSNDKYSVRLRQRLGGVEVDGGFVNVLLARDGAVLSIDTQALAGVAQFDPSPSLAASDARERAEALFLRQTGAQAQVSEQPLLLVERERVGRELQPRLVWSAVAHAELVDGTLEAFEYRFDAHTGELVQRLERTHDFDVSGTVRALVSPGSLPDVAYNTASVAPLPNVVLTSTSGTVTADANGNFNFVGATAPLQVTVAFAGPWSLGSNSAGTTYSLTTTLNSASGNQVLLNPSPSEQTTAQANAYLWVNYVHDWIKQLNPASTLADFQAPTNTNLAGACNAFYTTAGGQPSINFFRVGVAGTLSCVNMAYSSVVAHELGHWLNDAYSTGNGADGMGEGMADTFAMYRLDSPIVGEDFCGVGCHVRTGTNTRQYCGDGNSNCYGSGVHVNGEPLMGAFWKVRARLKATLGASAGAQAADTLFLAWLLAYDDSQINSIIETHWLVLDDDDGNILNGTPNFLDIDGGFRDQGFPGVNASLCPNVVNYCTSSTTTSGCTPTMTFSGTPSASATNGFTLSTFSVEGQRSGLIFYGISGRVAFPWIAGSTSWFCVKSPVQRTFVQNTQGSPNSCSGSMNIDWNNFRFVFPTALGNPIQSGQKVQAQAWFRDPPAPKTTNLSDALEFTVCP